MDTGPDREEILREVERLRTRLAELRSELADHQRLRRGVDAIPVQLCFIDADERHRIVNRACERRWNRTDIVGLTVRELLGEPMYQVAQPWVAEALSGREVSYESTIGVGTEAEHTFAATYVPEIADDGSVLGFFAMVTDSTKRKRAEKELRRSESRYRRLVDASHDAILVLGGDRVRYANDAAIQLLSASGRDELVGLPLSGIVSDASAGQLGGLIGGFGFSEAPVELEIRSFDGGRPLVEASAVEVYFGGRLALQVTLRDITRQKAMQKVLLRREKLETVGLVAGGIAHDFNNLLAGILGCIDLAAHLLPDGRPRAILAKARDGCLRAKELTDQLLSYARGGKPVRTTIQLGDHLLEWVRFALRGGNVAYDCDVGSALWPVEADPGQLSQVVDSLVINAAQAMPGGGRVLVSARNREITGPAAPGVVPGRYVQVRVRDHGPGIEASDRSRVFEPFFTRKPDAAGLGLATARAIVDEHGGFFEVDSTIGVGTELRFFIPAAVSAGTPGGSAPVDAPVAGSGRILVMDDDAGVRETVAEILRCLGYEPTLVTDGESALLAYGEADAEGRPYDAVLMDLTVPGGIGGVQATRLLLQQHPEARVVVCSGYSDDPAMDRPDDFGFAARVAKPYRVAELSRLLEAVIGSRVAG